MFGAGVSNRVLTHRIVIVVVFSDDWLLLAFQMPTLPSRAVLRFTKPYAATYLKPPQQNSQFTLHIRTKVLVSSGTLIYAHKPIH